MNLRSLRLPFAALVVTSLIACSDSSDRTGGSEPPVEPPPPPPPPEATYKAEIVWTEFGVPHILAQDWGGLGYGYGYAYAQENYCVAMRAAVDAAGDSAKYFGADGDFNRDLIFKLFNDEDTVQRLWDGLPEFTRENIEGYAAGMNRYLAETGVDNLAEGEEGCRGAEWVRDLESADVVRIMHKAILSGSADPLADFSAATNAPEATAMALPGMDHKELYAALDKQTVVDTLDMPGHEELGSNAYAVGADASQTNSGVLLGNPHFPWQGDRRWFMSHMVVEGEYDVLGATLGGLPMITIGFNKDVAWSHTVSTGSRFTFYELTLNPENPMQYEYDGEMRDITSRTVSADRMTEDGSVETVEHTFYFSHFGPIVDLGEVSPLLAGWPNAVGSLLTYRDANLENLRGIEQWVRMGQAENLGEFKEALRPIGIPWVNTIAADRYGDAFYGDISVNPHVTVAQYGSCIRGTLQTLLTDFGFPTMDGSDSECEWGSDEGTTDGIFGYDSLPKLETREYGGNANDSYWLPNPRHLLEGFSPVIGEERVEQSLRTRATFAQAEERLAGSDGLGEPGFNIDNIREMLFGSRNYTAEEVADDLVAVCSAVSDWSAYTANSEQAAQACDVLAAWDRKNLVDSVGAHIFHEFWLAFVNVEVENAWVVPFDPADPVNTPNQLNTEDADVVEAVRQTLAGAVDTLVDADIPMDRPWGEVQFDEKNGVRYGIHGGSSRYMFSVITSSLVPGEGYSNIVHGNSYMQAVTWDETDCPVAFNVLSYSQSTDPASPHYADGTELYSQSGWIDAPYCESERDAQELRRETIEE